MGVAGGSLFRASVMLPRGRKEDLGWEKEEVSDWKVKTAGMQHVRSGRGGSSAVTPVTGPTRQWLLHRTVEPLPFGLASVEKQAAARGTVKRRDSSDHSGAAEQWSSARLLVERRWQAKWPDVRVTGGSKSFRNSSNFFSAQNFNNFEH